MLEFWNLYNKLPLELKIKIMYKSGLQTNISKIIKDFNENLYIKIEECVYPKEKSYIQHLTNIGLLKHIYDLEDIILQLPFYGFDSDDESD